LSSGEYVTNKCGYHYKKKEHDADVSCFFVEVGAVIEPTSDMYINTDEEERCAVGVYIPD